MALPHKITDADLLDYIEGRMPASERARMALTLADNPHLAGQCAQIRAQIVNLRLLRSVLPMDRVPTEWMELLAQFDRHSADRT